MMRLKFGEWCL